MGKDEELLAQKYLSLATLYYSRRKIQESQELLEASRSRFANVSKTHFLLGKIYSETGDREHALTAFLKARDLDPFYEDIYKHLGNILSELGRPEEALESFVDAYILSGAADSSKTSYYQAQIRKLLSDLNRMDAQTYNDLFQQRKKVFQDLADSLSLKKSVVVTEEVRTLVDPSLPALVDELKRFSIMNGLSDEELIAAASITTMRSTRANEVIFREDDLSQGIFFIQNGSVRILKSTPFGEQVLTSLGAGEFFGEMDFIDSLHCSADAISNEDSVLLSISKEKLEELLQNRKSLAVQFYWHFWRTLSHRIRETNELLKSFFLDANYSDKGNPIDAGNVGEAIRVDLEKKMAVLKERGLSSRDLRLLATFSHEEFFRSGQTIFVEGDTGEELYIILEGQVRISKFIPGVGEEALAILEKGDFFGEMALINQAPRSADARAHTDVTVLPIESGLLTDILSRDVSSSYDFLYILCKILSHRLREINLKIYQWRIMSGGF